MYGENRDMNTPAMIFSTFGLYRILIYRIFAIGPWSLGGSKLLSSYTQPRVYYGIPEVDHDEALASIPPLNEGLTECPRRTHLRLLGPNGAARVRSSVSTNPHHSPRQWRGASQVAP